MSGKRLVAGTTCQVSAEFMSGPKQTEPVTPVIPTPTDIFDQ